MDQQEPLEAGEDGTFDLGDPSPPPSPTKPVTIPVARTQDAAGNDSEAPAAPESELSGSPPIADDWEKVDLQVVAGNGSTAAGGTGSPPTEEPLEEFKDAIEIKPQSCTETSAGGGGVKGEPARPAPSAERPATVIAAGLASVRLPMGYDRREGRLGEGDPADSDGEEEFHDAHDSGPGMVKDATKAREMKELGNGHYRNREFEDAVDYYTMALHYCPEDEEHKKDKAVYLANRAQGHLQLEEYDTVVDDCTAALELDPRYVKALLRRQQANERLEKYDLAVEDAKGVLEIDPSSRSAKESVARLEKLQHEKNEKMKEEAIGKLKELGNSFLGNFGLSLDNLKTKQDPETGAYSISFG
eukprot:g4829.t1